MLCKVENTQIKHHNELKEQNKKFNLNLLDN